MKGAAAAATDDDDVDGANAADVVEAAAATEDTLRCLVISMLEDASAVFLYGNYFNYC